MFVLFFNCVQQVVQIRVLSVAVCLLCVGQDRRGRLPPLFDLGRELLLKDWMEDIGRVLKHWLAVVGPDEMRHSWQQLLSYFGFVDVTPGPKHLKIINIVNR